MRYEGCEVWTVKKEDDLLPPLGLPFIHKLELAFLVFPQEIETPLDGVLSASSKIPVKYSYFEFTLDILVVGGENSIQRLVADSNCYHSWKLILKISYSEKIGPQAFHAGYFYSMLPLEKISLPYEVTQRPY